MDTLRGHRRERKHDRDGETATTEEKTAAGRKKPQREERKTSKSEQAREATTRREGRGGETTGQRQRNHANTRRTEKTRQRRSKCRVGWLPQWTQLPQWTHWCTMARVAAMDTMLPQWTFFVADGPTLTERGSRCLALSTILNVPGPRLTLRVGRSTTLSRRSGHAQGKTCKRRNERVHPGKI